MRSGVLATFCIAIAWPFNNEGVNLRCLRWNLGVVVGWTGTVATCTLQVVCEVTACLVFMMSINDLGKLQIGGYDQLTSCSWLLFVVCCLLFVVCCLLFAVCCLLVVTCYLLLVTCYLLLVTCCCCCCCCYCCCCCCVKELKFFRVDIDILFLNGNSPAPDVS